MEGVNSRQEEKASPAKVEARSIQCNIQSVEIAGFPVEELCDVNCLKNHIGQQAEVKLVLFLDAIEAEQHYKNLPHNHSDSAVG